MPNININTSLFKINKEIENKNLKLLDIVNFLNVILEIKRFKRAKLIMRYRENIKNHYSTFINKYNLANKKISIDSITGLYSTELESRLNI